MRQIRQHPRGLAAAPLAALVLALSAAGPAVPATPPGVVEVQSAQLTGTRPDGSTVVIKAKATASGTDLSSLSGDGRHLGSGGVHAYWPVTGSAGGNVVTLAGVVTEVNNPDYVGSPIQIVGDVSTGMVTLRFGPLAGGRFAGHTIVAEGPGQVSVRTAGG